MPRSRSYVNDLEQWATCQRHRDEELGVVNREFLELFHRYPTVRHVSSR